MLFELSRSDVHLALNVYRYSKQIYNTAPAAVHQIDPPVSVIKVSVVEAYQVDRNQRIELRRYGKGRDTNAYFPLEKYI